MAFQIFDENLVAIEKQKTQVQINRPFYAGFTILELAKLHMYRFHYDYIMKKYPAAELLFTDTDSLYYHLLAEDLEEELFLDKEHFDYSDYEKTGKFYDESNRKVIGKFKCETKGNPIVEFVGLRPKMYSYLYQEKTDPTSKIKEKHRVKGITAAASRALKHFDYKDQLDRPHQNYLTNKRIGSKLHQIYAMSCDKRGLCSYDDKRFLMADGIRSLAYGHHSITKDIQRDEIKNCGGEQLYTTAEARSRGLIWARRKGAFSRLGLKEPEWNETNEEAIVNGVNAKLAAEREPEPEPEKKAEKRKKEGMERAPKMKKTCLSHQPTLSLARRSQMVTQMLETKSCSRSD